MDVDVKLAIYTATAEKSWEKVCLNRDLNSGPQLHSLRLWPLPHKYVTWLLMWNLPYIQLLLRKAEKKFASTGIWTPALSFTVWHFDRYTTNAWIIMCGTSTVTSMSSSSFVGNIVTSPCFIYRMLQQNLLVVFIISTVVSSVVTVSVSKYRDLCSLEALGLFNR